MKIEEGSFIHVALSERKKNLHGKGSKKGQDKLKDKRTNHFHPNSISCHIYKVERVHHMGLLFILWMGTEPIVTNSNMKVLRIWTKSTHYQVSRGKYVIKSPLWKDANTFPKPFFSLIKPRVSIEWDHLTINCRCTISFIDVAVILAFA